MPFIRRLRHDREVAGLTSDAKELRYRIFVLRDNMKEAKHRVGFNITRCPDNAAAYRVLDIALINDLEKELGTNA